MDQLEALAEEIQEEFEQVNAARDQAYQRSRKLISLCARSIRAMHRSEWETADALLAELGEAKETMVAGVEGYPMLYYAGYTQDAVKEYV
jgi:translin